MAGGRIFYPKFPTPQNTGMDRSGEPFFWGSWATLGGYTRHAVWRGGGFFTQNFLPPKIPVWTARVNHFFGDPGQPSGGIPDMPYGGGEDFLPKISYPPKFRYGPLG